MFNPDAAERAEIAAGCRSAGIGCVDCKKKLNAHIQEMMAPIHERRARYAGDKKRMDEILAHGAERARAKAKETMETLYPAMGLLPALSR